MADSNAPPLPEISALQKHACPACGAEAVWTPAQHALVCPYCGTVSPAELSADGTTIVEHDLVTALRSIPEDKRGVPTDRVSVQCQSCKAISVFETGRVAQRCDFCGSPAIVPYDAMKAPIRPESVLPFRVSEPQVREQMRKWYGSRWFAPNKLKSAALTDTVHGIYIPYWTFDAQVAADWTAEAGHYYYENVTRDGKTEREQRIRWESAAGSLSHFFDDELVAATRGVNMALLKKVEPFPTDALKPYDTGYVSGWVVEQYQIDLVAAAANARQQMEGKVRQMCSEAVPGDTQRNLQVQSDYSAQTFKHILVPLWLLGYTYGARTFQVLVNGVSGKIAGKYPYSWVKILFAVLAAIIALMIWAWLDQK
jgi:ribosomal protein S27E